MTTNDMQNTTSDAPSSRIMPQIKPEGSAPRDHGYRGIIWVVAIILVIIVVCAIAYQVITTNSTKPNPNVSPAAIGQLAPMDQLNKEQQQVDAIEAKQKPAQPLTSAQLKNVNTSFNSIKSKPALTTAQLQALNAYMQSN